MFNPLTGDEMRAALTKAGQVSAELGRPVCIIHNRLWDWPWNGPWRVVVKPERGDQVIARDVKPARDGSEPVPPPAPALPSFADVPRFTALRRDLPGYQE